MKRAAGLLLASLVLLGGCISASEYRAFVDSSRRFYDRAAPVVTSAIAADGSLSETSKKNRTAWVADYGLALEAAEKRAAK